LSRLTLHRFRKGIQKYVLKSQQHGKEQWQEKERKIKRDWGGNAGSVKGRGSLG